MACARSKFAEPLLLLALLLPLPALAGLATDSFQVHGYLAQGLVLTDGNDFFGDSTDGSFDYHELGINVSWRPLSRLLLAAQLQSRDAGATGDPDPRLDYALADLRLLSGQGLRGGVRGGRIKLPYGFYNDTRDVVFTRPGVLLPQSAYQESLGIRDLLFSADAVETYLEADWGLHSLRASAIWVDDIRADGLTRDNTLGAPGLPATVNYDNARLFRLMDVWDGGRMRFALTLLPFDVRINPTIPESPALPRVRQDVLTVLLSAEWSGERLTLTGEYSRQGTREHLPGFGLENSRNGDGLYLQARWRHNNRVTSLLRVDADFTDLHDRHGRAFERAGNGPRHRQFSRTLTVGLRWDIRPQLALWAEHHYIDGTASVPVLENTLAGRSPEDYERYWNISALMLGYRF